MAPIYLPPSLPIHANIYTYVSPGPPSVLRLTVPCQLRVWRPYSLAFAPIGAHQRSYWLRALLVSAGVDVRGVTDSITYDGDLVEIVERPGFFYQVWDVDDMWKGFPNEYRIAVMGRMPAWPWPLP